MDVKKGIIREAVFVLGASENPARYSNMAIRLLTEYGHEVLALGRGAGQVGSTTFLQDFPAQINVDTITMYLSPSNQEDYIQEIVELKPKRIIFNPGAENPSKYADLRNAGIEIIEACTLVMLRTGQF